MSSDQLQLSQVSIGVLTALPQEYAAAKRILGCEEELATQGKPAHVYALGRITSTLGGQHVVAVALLPGMGNNLASIVTVGLLRDCPGIRYVIMCGIAGAVPHPDLPEEHVRLGDIVVCNSQGVVQYDFVKETRKSRRKKILVKPRHSPRPPASGLLQAVTRLHARDLGGERPWEAWIEEAINGLGKGWERPGDEYDHLSDWEDEPPVDHPYDMLRRPGVPRVFSGTIGSANILLKDPGERDLLRDQFGVKAIEMEGSGLSDATWNEGEGYIVVRGTCDYCNHKKSDRWQKYAALVAAAYTRAIIAMIPPFEMNGASLLSDKRDVVTGTERIFGHQGDSALWESYATKHKAVLQQPLIVPELTLEHTYVPQRCFMGGPRSFATNQPRYQLETAQPIGDLLQHWLERGDDQDAIRFILGGPGSGKSSELKMLAVKAEQQCDVRVLLIPVTRLVSTTDIGASLETFIATEIGALENPWTRKTGLTRYLIIFDGLDELALLGPEAMGKAEVFPITVRDTRPRGVKGRGLVQVIISGRPIALQQLSDQFSDECFLHMMPMYLPASRAVTQTPELAALYEGQPDLRGALWDKLLATKHPDGVVRDESGMPSLFKTNSFLDLTDSPLHNVLLWTAYCEAGEKIAFQSRSSLFERHARQVFNRRYGDRQAARPAPFAYESYEAAMRECAVASWKMGGRAFLLKSVRDRCAGTEMDEIVTQTIVRDRDRPGPGLVAFYTRQTSTEEGEGAVEFTLKPFADFLISRRILAEVRRKLPSYNLSYPMARPVGLNDLSAFAVLMATDSLTPDILVFLKAECQDMSEDEARVLRQCCFNFMQELVWTGIHVPSWAEFDQLSTIQRTLVGLLSLISCLSLRLQERETIPWGTSTNSAAKILHAANTGRNHPDQNMLKHALNWIDLSEQDLYAMDFGFAQLSHAGFRGARASFAQFHDAQMDYVDAAGASFEDADFQRAMLYRANFTHAHLDNANLKGATLIELRGNEAVAPGIDCMGADMQFAKLVGARVEGSNFTGALLMGADLRGADLRATILEGAFLGHDIEEQLYLARCVATEDLLGYEIFFGDPDEPQSCQRTTLGRLGWQIVDGRLTKN